MLPSLPSSPSPSPLPFKMCFRRHKTARLSCDLATAAAVMTLSPSPSLSSVSVIFCVAVLLTEQKVENEVAR